MLLSKILEVIYPQEIQSYKENINVKYITTNSKLAIRNSIYIVDFKKNIKREFINEAIKNGAVAILTNKKIKSLKIPQFIVSNLKLSVNLILHSLKSFPPNNIIGITGTNGKTSVVWLISSILKYSGINVKSLGTLGYYKNLKKSKESSLTTPEKEELHQFSYSSSYKKTEFVFEVSSHGISKKRIDNLPINVAAITNITQDHLDYHRTFKNYKNTKFKIFFKYLSKKGIAIINDNLNNANYLKQKLKKDNIKIISYGKNTSDVNYIFDKERTIIRIYSKKYLIKFCAIKNFEFENLACSICCCLAIGLKNKQIINSISKISKPDGRMQLVDSLYNGAKIFVDYAHTPDALKNILLREDNNYKKPDLVFGCGGNRDKIKRIKMAKIACQYANKIYITDDNPRNENPYFIRKKISSYCSKAFNIGNRRQAIKTAINNLDSKTILIIAGKGHEKKQIIKNKIINFDDAKVAKYFIKKRNLRRL